MAERPQEMPAIARIEDRGAAKARGRVGFRIGAGLWPSGRRSAPVSPLARAPIRTRGRCGRGLALLLGLALPVALALPVVLPSVLALAVILALPAAASAMPDIGAVCERAATLAARETGVPLSVLRAVSLTETGRKQGGSLRPWPWTVNMEGKGNWFDDMGAALAYVEREMTRGATSFDVGCFQINYRWHGENFTSVRQMFDPLANARYAARFLGNLHAELGDWSLAAGAFHSRTPEFAQRYRARFDRIRADLGREADVPEIPDIVLAENRRLGLDRPPRVNLYPLLQGGNGARGSLFPATARGAQPLIGPGGN